MRLCSIFFFSPGIGHEEGSGSGAVARVVTVEGGRAELPCDTSAPAASAAAGDSIYLVLWYNSLDSSGTPIYR